MYEFKLPDIGEGIVEAELVSWAVREGERIEENQIVAELLTDKASIEVPSPRAGRVQRLCFAPGDTVPVGAVLLEIDDGAPAPGAAPEEGERAGRAAGEELQPAAREAAARETAGSAAAPAAPPPATGPGSSRPGAASAPVPARGLAGTAGAGEHRPPPMPPRPGSRAGGVAPERPTDRVRAVPAVRELAHRLGVDLASVEGTGPGGRILRRDVERHLEAREGSAGRSPARGTTEGPRPPPAPDPADWRREPLRGLRRAIAEHMSLAARRAVHFTYVDEVDVTELEARRRALAARVDDISPLAFTAWAAVRVLPRHPRLNATLDDERGEVVLKGKVHLGIATATEEGLLVPVIRDAGDKPLRELAAAIRDLADRARAKALSHGELQGSTFTISSLGKLGGLMATPIVNFPETAILGVHAIRRVPRYVGERLEPRQVLCLSVSCDHRLVDGIDCARFVAEVKEILESGDFPGLDGV